MLACALAASVSRVAHADDDNELPPKTEAKTSAKEWYGWQTLIVDASLMGLYASGHLLSPPGSTALEMSDFFAFWFGAAIVHQLHDGEVGTSIAIHFAGPFAGLFTGFLIGAALPYSCSGFLCFNPMVVTGAEIGMGIGAGIVAIVDATVLSWGRAEPKPTTSAWIFAPSVSPRGGGLTLGRAF